MGMFVPVLAALAAAVCALPLPFPAADAVTFSTDVDTMPFPASAPTPGLTMKSWSGKVDGKPYTAHLAVVQDPRYFRFELPPGGIPKLSKTSETAAYRSCNYATNGGFFDMSTGYPVANVVVNGTVVASFDKFAANFALQDNEYVTGYITQSDVKTGQWRQMLQGAGWLVRKGQPHVNVSVSTGEVSVAFALEMAPRWVPPSRSHACSPTFRLSALCCGLLR